MLLKFPSLALMAAFGLALAFIFSCSGNDGGGEQSYDYCITSDNACLAGPFTTSTCTGQLSNSCPNGSNPSVGGSSSSGGDGSSSSGGGNSLPNGSGPKGAISKRVLTSIYYGSNGYTSTSIYTTKYDYDNKGNLIKEIEYNENESISSWYEYEYENGNRIKRTSRNSDGSISSYYLSEYNNKGNEIKRVSYKADESISTRYQYEYDSNGNMTKEVRCSPDGNTCKRYELTYDSNGNMIKNEEFDTQGNLTENYIYTWSGNKVTYDKYNGTVFSYKAEETYITVNSKKLGTLYIRENSDGSKEKREREYDAKGNRTKSIEYKWDETTESYVKEWEDTYVYTYIN